MNQRSLAQQLRHVREHKQCKNEPSRRAVAQQESRNYEQEIQVQENEFNRRANTYQQKEIVKEQRIQ
ncbi:15126_t:CDS:2 [Dentiscutata erythropus]|uniref:15126_t:CDS:1 n=1 Tax=Dentiscutata erythropus TaxID=1348616 RepID=A0A9N9C9P8_9GLOM|nr:15126_t:CDS:2 [Dentiscutata erythropus]